ncbi:NUDIX hydrolase [bacterium]|nr:NUDIX hydrolase [bacterium]
MSLGRWTRRAGEVLLRNPWWEYRRDDVTLPSGSRGEYHFVHTPGSVMVIPEHEDGRIVLVRQYRYLNDRESVEFPAGGVKEGQGREQAARAELREEAGLEAAELQEIGQFNPFNGVTDELCSVYLARGLRACAAAPDETEEFEILTLRSEEFPAMVKDGRIWDGMTLATWSLLRSMREQK